MKKIDRGFLAKLKKMLINLEDVRTVDGRNLMVDGDIEVGKDIMIMTDGGEYESAPSGEYDTGEVVLIVDAGRITEIREKSVEETENDRTEEVTVEVEGAEEVVEDEVVVETPDSNEVDDLRAENDRLRAENEELRARIAELEGRINAMAAVPDVRKDAEGEESKPLANKFIIAAHKKQ